jgi:hypothetical protein
MSDEIVQIPRLYAYQYTPGESPYEAIARMVQQEELHKRVDAMLKMRALRRQQKRSEAGCIVESSGQDTDSTIR